MLQHLRSFFARFRPRKRAALRLSVTDDGVSLFADDQPAWTFQWTEVTRIDTYKRDLFAVDMICLDFMVATRQLTFSTDDQMQGFDLLCRQLRHVFPSIAPDWWLQVAFPAFAIRHSVLYEAPAA